MSDIVELFGRSIENQSLDWHRSIQSQQCIFLGKTCYKVRKSAPDIAIGSCTVLHGKPKEPVVICPTRLTEHRQIFVDCLHLLTTHEPGNELHLLPEVTIPGGSVDYFLVSAKAGKVKDLVGIEIQAVDTTGTIWPERQRVLHELGLHHGQESETHKKSFGINWKMTAKTTLFQLHHKIETFEHVNKKLVLVLQDTLLAYMNRQFNFSHMTSPPAIGDSMHFHAYHMEQQPDRSYKLRLNSRLSTDAAGVDRSLGLQAETRLELDRILQTVQARLSTATLFAPNF